VHLLSLFLSKGDIKKDTSDYAHVDCLIQSYQLLGYWMSHCHKQPGILCIVYTGWFVGRQISCFHLTKMLEHAGLKNLLSVRLLFIPTLATVFMLALANNNFRADMSANESAVVNSLLQIWTAHRCDAHSADRLHKISVVIFHAFVPSPSNNVLSAV